MTRIFSGPITDPGGPHIGTEASFGITSPMCTVKVRLAKKLRAQPSISFDISSVESFTHLILWFTTSKALEKSHAYILCILHGFGHYIQRWGRQKRLIINPFRASWSNLKFLLWMFVNHWGTYQFWVTDWIGWRREFEMIDARRIVCSPSSPDILRTKWCSRWMLVYSQLLQKALPNQIGRRLGTNL